MIMGYNMETQETTFRLSRAEYKALLAGGEIVKITGDADWEWAKFTLKFEGKKRD